jgi:tRNA-dihydrouridine synthase A
LLKRPVISGPWRFAGWKNRAGAASQARRLPRQAALTQLFDSLKVTHYRSPMTGLANLYHDHRPRFAVAPMMDWTDRHCRFFHRQLTRRALLYSEMVTADAVIHGDRARLIGFSPQEHPLALQVGGSEPAKLAEAARIAESFGYDEINLNCGCPSDRVQSGAFGACLMREPELVARGVDAMKHASRLPVTVKCRIGVDEQQPEIALRAMVRAVAQAGADAVWVHARKAWLQGLSPRENRDVPPLDYGLVHAVKQENRSLFIGINGGVADLNQALVQLGHVDGVMLGRAAYQEPALLAGVDARIHGDEDRGIDLDAVVDAMADYTDAHVAQGGKASNVLRHMLGLFNGRPGARRFRQMLTVDSLKPGAAGEVLRAALAHQQEAEAAFQAARAA